MQGVHLFHKKKIKRIFYFDSFHLAPLLVHHFHACLNSKWFSFLNVLSLMHDILQVCLNIWRGKKVPRISPHFLSLSSFLCLFLFVFLHFLLLFFNGDAGLFLPVAGVSWPLLGHATCHFTRRWFIDWLSAWSGACAVPLPAIYHSERTRAPGITSCMEKGKEHAWALTLPSCSVSYYNYQLVLGGLN